MIRLRQHARQVVFALVLIALFLWAISRLFTWGTCAWYGSQTGREVRHAAFIGCMVKTGDTWVPRSELRVVQ